MWMNPSGICSQKCTRLFSPASAFFAAFRRAPCQRCQDQKFSAEVSLKLAEIADVAVIGIHQPSCSNIRSEGNRRDHPQRDISLNKTEKTRKLKDLSISENGTQRSSNQDEIIALLKRIQVSISRGQSTSSRRTNQNISRQKKPAKSLLRTLRRHPRKKQTKG
ncbi:uncharacterized protein LOC109845027 isoform X2 [Asparagus officinalis]|nr:uncharacterized protein LOC109845027 isoform X2 [Asparagus officinalis]